MTEQSKSGQKDLYDGKEDVLRHRYGKVQSVVNQYDLWCIVEKPDQIKAEAN